MLQVYPEDMMTMLASTMQQIWFASCSLQVNCRMQLGQHFLCGMSAEATQITHFLKPERLHEMLAIDVYGCI